MCGSIPRSSTSQPASVRAVGAVGDQPLGVEAEALHRAVDHGARGADLRLADRARRLDVDDDRIVCVDEVVGRIGEEGVPLLGAGPLRRGIGGRGELRLDRARRAEGRVVENREVLPDRARRRVGIDRRRVPVLAGGRALLVRIRLDQAGVDGEPLAADEPLRDAPATVASKTWRSRSQSRNRPCRFLEKVEWSGTRSARSRRQNHL